MSNASGNSESLLRIVNAAQQRNFVTMMDTRKELA